jgi:phospholipid-binding lipoprotein MlaA
MASSDHISLRTMNSTSSVAVAVAALTLAGCAAPAKKDPRDPFERVNRVSYTITDAVDRAALKPAARAYRFVTPNFVETGVSNFFDNITYPTVVLNDFLQGKFTSALHDTGRFVLNTTVGIGGIFDPATAAGLQKNDEDFGQTLGKWGVPSGPYIFIPLMGPSTVRDGVGRIPDTFTNPVTYIDDNAYRYGLAGLNIVNSRAQLLDTEKAIGEVYDRYAILRSAYLQRREYQVHDGDVPEEQLEEFPEDEEPAGEAPKKDEPK